MTHASNIHPFLLQGTNACMENAHLSQAHWDVLFQAIKYNPMCDMHAYLAVHLPTNSICFQHNLAPFFGISQNISLLQFIDLIHPDYIQSFLRWAKAAYLLYENMPEIIPFKKCYKIKIPMQNLAGEYYWVLQESYILEHDVMQKAINQLNVYSIISKYESCEQVFAAIYDAQGIDKKTNEQLLYYYNTIHNFHLTTQEILLLKTIQENAAFNYEKIGQLLDIQEETVKCHAKNILKKAKNAFDIPFKTPEKATIKQLIHYLEKINYF